MIGCEVRTYARLGLGYSTALSALPGFYLGYLPYTLYQESIDKVVFGAGLTEYITIAEWAADSLGASEQIWAFAYSALMVAILLGTFVVAKRFLMVGTRDLMIRNTDELFFTPAGS